MTIFFCYELSHNGWNAVAYHGEKPRKNENSLKVERSSFYEVPDDCIGANGEPMFGKLQTRFPSP